MPWGAIASLAGSILDNVFNKQQSSNSAKVQYINQTNLNKQGYKYSLALQNHQNQFSQSMFNQSAELASKAHQIEVADLRSAGLNPILSATGGNGASVVSPMSGGSASMSGGSAGMPESPKSQFLNAINTARQLKNDTQRVKNETTLMGDTLLNNRTNRHLTDVSADKAEAEAQYTRDQNESYNTWNPVIQQATLDSIISGIEANKSTVARNKAEIVNSTNIANSQVGLNRANSAKVYDDIKNRPITNSESINFGPVKFGYTSTKQGNGNYDNKKVQARMKKSPITNPRYGSYR